MITHSKPYSYDNYVQYSPYLMLCPALRTSEVVFSLLVSSLQTMETEAVATWQHFGLSETTQTHTTTQLLSYWQLYAGHF